MSQILINAGTDRVIAEYPLPVGGKLNGVHLECHVLGLEESLATHMFMYGISGFVVPLPDPDAAINVDTLWDNLIPKDLDAGSGVFDIDTGALDATPEFEIGELDLTAIFDIQGLAPREIFRRRKRITLASNPSGFQQIASSADLLVPLDFFATQIKKAVRVSSPSMVLFGFSSPDLTQTTATVRTAPLESQWFQYQFLEMTIEQMLMFVGGLVESGAETPYEEASAFIADLIEATVFEQSAGFYDAITWNCYTTATFDVSVPGRMNLGVLTSE